jgi:acyl dehydratase
VRYTGVVPAGSRVCLYQTIKAAEPEKNHGIRLISECKIVVEGHDKPALIAEIMAIFYP